MAAALHCWPPPAVAAVHRPLSSSSPPPRRPPRLRLLSTRLTPLPHLPPLSTKNSRRPASKVNAGKYIGEDYLVKKVTAKEVEELVRGARSKPLVLDFYATWCGPCILMAQELEMLAVEYEDDVMFLKVDTDDEYEFARDMQVRGLPTLYFISPDPNKDAIRTEGLVPSEMIKNIINNEL